ncbi:unnamed protein product [Ostreobium quekettii]|uniref:Uncharacterized protein n=1 Tax=Ostreobium quekettii TaxID=121088 RepID=A0A8S1JBJ9_9CHLO|nr:unnamed protein product [Ostreobium quekettii]
MGWPHLSYQLDTATISSSHTHKHKHTHTFGEAGGQSLWGHQQAKYKAEMGSDTGRIIINRCSFGERRKRPMSSYPSDGSTTRILTAKKLLGPRSQRPAAATSA